MSYLVRRLLATIPVLLGVFTLTFLLIHLIPGDPVDLMLGDQASHLDKDRVRKELGLDQPLWDQYTIFLKNLAKGQLGNSLQSRRPIVSEIVDRFPATVELTVAAMLLTVAIGVPLGVLAAVKQYSWVDHLVSVGGLFGMSMPGFWLGPMLILVFAVQLDWLPISERGGVEHLILPALSLAVMLSAIVMRMTRSQMLDVIKEDYIMVARAKGLSPLPIYFKHALMNALSPIITILGLQVGALLTGTVITETIFDWPGIGTLLFSAIQQRDYPLVQGCVLFIAVTYVLVNLVTDLSYAIVNPRVRLS